MRNIVIKFVLLASLLGVSSAVSAQIYKTVDADGNVVFTDVPPKDDSKSVKLDVYNTYSDPVTTRADTGAVAAQEPELGDEEAPISYGELRITWPTHDGAVRENTGNVSVKVAAEPKYDPASGHRVQVLLDGNPKGDAAANAVALSNIDRGTHALVAQIIDTDGNVLVSSSPVTFHMMRVSIQSRTKAQNNGPKSGS